VTNRSVSGWWWPALAALVLAVLPWPSGLVDAAYSRGVYRVGQSIVTTISNVTPWTWLDVFILAALVFTIRRIYKLARGPRADGVPAVLWEGTRRAIRAGGLLMLAFLAFWGLNYRRTSLADTIGALPVVVAAAQPAGPVTTYTEEVRALLIDAAALAARTRPAARPQPAGYDQIARALPGPFNEALARVGRPRLGVPGRPKYTMLTPFFTRAGVTGMIDPFALESLVHPDLLPFERPFVLAHEWGHLAGLADEAEASALAWSACMRGDAGMVYSASMFLIVEAGAALPAPIWREMQPTLDRGVREDLASLAERWQLIEPTVQKASSKVYDQYLKANRVEDGVASYSRSLRLLLLPVFREQFSSDPGGQARRE
jgi:hypothetical protein